MPSGDVRQTWLARLFSTESADRDRSEAAARDLYASAGFAEPRHLCWFDSPFLASWAIAVLLEAQHPVWRNLIGAARSDRASKQQVADAEDALCRACGVTAIAEARAAIGKPRGMSLHYMPQPDSMFQPALLRARMTLHGGNVAAFAAAPKDDLLSAAEQRLCVGARAVLASPLICHPAGTLVAQSFSTDYPMARMAADEEAARGDVPTTVRAAWDIAAACGLWWPFSGGAIFAERPAELHTDPNGLLHREDGAAAVYRDATRVYAWHGTAVAEDWILHPELIPPAKLRGFDPTFRKYVESKRTAAPPPRPARESAILAAKLPIDAAGRLQALRTHAGGTLPLFDRYVAGECAAVWQELISRGADVRRDPLAADALAVAYETMRRVRENVRTIVSRLTNIGFEFTTPVGELREAADAHVPPDSRAPKQIRQLEKAAGPVPLSLRLFLEVVGAVDLVGRHPNLAPPKAVVAPDPFVIVSLDDLAAGMDASDEADLLILAPDDLHKAGTSGGDPYAMAVPDPAADAVLLNERHELLFVDYLRLCCRFGGFPGYEGQEHIPVEIEFLRRDLLEF